MRFAVKAMRGEAVVDLQLDAEDDIAAREEALRQGYRVLTVRKTGRFLSAPLHARFPVGLFSIQLVSLLDAGLNLVEAIRALAVKERHPPRRRVLEEILSSLRSGASFSQAVDRLPRHFPRVYVAIVQASERTGDLRRALDRYLDYEAKFAQLRKKVASAIVYPAVLMVAGSLVLSFLLFYVVPRFARVYEDMSGTLPFF